MAHCIKYGLRLIVILIFLISGWSTFAQKGKIITLSGQIVEEDTQKPISFASIHIKGQEIGTISDSLGKFSFDFDKKFNPDSVIVSCVGYKRFQEKIADLKLKSPLTIELSDSLFMLDEVIALCYNHIEPHVWSTKNKNKKKMMLSFATRKMETALNYIKVLKENHGKFKEKADTYIWKNVKIRNFELKKFKTTLALFSCSYCPLEGEYIVALDVKDLLNNNLLDNKLHKQFLIDYFQDLLDKSLGQGIDFNQLEFKNKLAFKKESEVTYTGKAFSYYDKGQKGKIGEFRDGIKEGVWTWWFENGIKGKEVLFEGGKMVREGIWWYPNGQIKRKSTFSYGKKNGPSEMYFENGTKKFEGTYLNDNMHGICTWWYSSGEKKKESTYDNGVFRSKIEWDKKGNIIEKVIFN